MVWPGKAISERSERAPSPCTSRVCTASAAQSATRTCSRASVWRRGSIERAADLGALRSAVGPGDEIEQRGVGGTLEPHESGIHAVERGARHEPDCQCWSFGHRVRTGGGSPTMARRRPACSASSFSASLLGTPRRAMTMAVFTLPSAASMALRAVGAIYSGRFHDDALAPVDQLVVPGPQVHHQVAVGLAEPDHGAGGECVQHELRGGSRLHSGGAGDDLRARRAR